MLEQLLAPFRSGEQLFITARTHGPQLSMWQTESKATALYWCASAFAKLWRGEQAHASTSPDGAENTEPHANGPLS